MRHSNESILDSLHTAEQGARSPAASGDVTWTTLDPEPYAQLARRRQTAGVTLIEVMIVVAIMALLSSGVAVFVMPKLKEAQVSTAKTSAQVLRRAIQDWQRVNAEISCPAMTQLVDGKHIDSTSSTDDPWGMPWAFTCTDDEIFVQSTGPDKKAGTEDDISVPKLRADAER
jgi:general secretion pathway protein G